MLRGYNPTHHSGVCEPFLRGLQWGEIGKASLGIWHLELDPNDLEVTYWLTWNFLVSRKGDDNAYLIDLR